MPAQSGAPAGEWRTYGGDLGLLVKLFRAGSFQLSVRGQAGYYTGQSAGILALESLVFIGVHLPAYLADRGMPPHVAVTALALWSEPETR